MNHPETEGNRMIDARRENDQTKQLTADEISGIRNAWGCGVPLKMLARQRGISERELRLQIGEPQWTPTPEPDRQRTLFDCEGSR